MNQFIFWEELNEFCFLSVEVLKIFHSDATEEPFLPPQITFFYYCEEHVNSLNNVFIIKNLLWNGKVPWMLKVLCGTIHVNKEPLFLRVIMK